MQLVFSDDFNTPIFETKWQQNSKDLVEGKLETIDIHPKATITAIAMKVWDRAETETSVDNNNQKEPDFSEHGSTFLGIKLENENCEEIISEEWGTDCEDKGRWMYSDVPVGSTIVGLQVGGREKSP